MGANYINFVHACIVRTCRTCMGSHCTAYAYIILRAGTKSCTIHLPARWAFTTYNNEPVQDAGPKMGQVNSMHAAIDSSATFTG